MKKVVNRKEAKRIVEKLKKEGKKIVFTNGCFDILHPGHIKLLREAKEKGDCLIVGLNSDKSIKKIKGEKRPILKENARAKILSAIEYVDFIVFFDEKTPYRLIKYLKPNFLVKGADWKREEIIGKEFVERIYRVTLLKNFSTTGIIDHILKKFFHK
ncbi:MAG: D-glycero-beta-D-manno-heptose 1-phosphate adenylyltransferase [Candidatus Omnitrophica bacterium 4484_70.1]|nr:MAG: D-glycero-beta-D-manno-heptose 1-phosphate adenylyltransferase [Candidatus Omnitrophica bacterium 4484_70.1]